MPTVICMHCAFPIERKQGRWALVGDDTDQDMAKHLPDWR